MRFRTTLFAAVLLGWLAIGGWLIARVYRELQALLLETVEQEVRSQALLVARVLGRSPPVQQVWDASLDERIDRLATELGVRITVVAPGGEVLADSGLDRAALRRAAPLLGQPEILEARRTGEVSVRACETGHQTLFYAARALGSGTGHVVRVARPAFELGRLRDLLGRAVLVPSGLALLLAIALPLLAGRLVRQPLAGLVRQARLLAHPSVPAPPHEDEVQALSRTLDAVGTELQQLMQAIAAEREELATIVRTLTAGLLLLDSKGRIALMNPAFCEMFECSASLIGRLVAEIVRQPELLRALQESRERLRPQSVKLELQGSRQCFLEVSLVPLEQAGPCGVLALFHDVTRLERVERMRKDFVANASHELRTPVASISACAESLLADPRMPLPQQQRFLEMIQRNCRRLGRLGQDLLELARAEHERSGLRPARVKLEEVLDRIESDLAESLARNRLRLDRKLAPDATEPYADPDALERILANLLENAIRYSPPGDRIEVRSQTRPGGLLRLEVEDHGEGIPAEHLPRIFERFYRADRARSRRDGGTGLGLAIVRHLAEAHGGSVRAASEPGVRTVLTLELPGPPNPVETT